MPQSKTSESVVCPECQARFEIEPTSSAGAFNCPKCGKPASLGALRNPDLRPEAWVIAGATGEASTENVYRHTVAYVFNTRDDAESCATGTLVQIDDKLFVATVRHAIPHSVSSIALVKKRLVLSQERLECVTRRAVSDYVDVAVFELQPNTVARVGLDPIGLDRIHDGRTGNTNFKTRLMGFPAAWVLSRNPLPGIKGFHGLGYGCETIEPSRWPAISTIPGTFDKDTDIVVEFSRDTVDFGSKLPVPAGMPDPFGMSGGGLWQRTVAVKDDEIWTADGLCLFGIQSTWLDEKGFLKAVQIIHWLKLVADEYPELRGELCERYPRLKKLTK